MMTPSPEGTLATFADVALPIPLPDPLIYEIPPAWASQAVPGVRTRVTMGRRRLTGVIVGVHPRRPEGVAIRPIEEVLDREPVLTADLLELARFVADYYLAPLGEVIRSMLPSDLPPWGDRKVWLTDAGAMALPRSPAETAIVDALREGGRMSVAELQARSGLPDLDEVLALLAEGGRIGSEAHRSRSARYVNAVELAPGDLAAHLAAAGRSAAGRGVVDYLAAVGRPATVAEVAAAVGCTPAVLRRLVGKGVLRQFTQVERLSLDRHILGIPEKNQKIVLRDDQAHALGRITEILDRREFAPLLLQGMTGSGKTEVYLRAAEETLARGRSAILLVPEIALVPALARTAERRFGGELAILHSGLGTGERHQEWERVRRGEARVVLGPRSALFAPVADLGLVVVDEEQDSSYKQEVDPRYNARDLALVRGRDASAVTLLVSATPSLESRFNSERGKLELLQLTQRAGPGTLPEGILVDLREEGVSRRPGEVHFSKRLQFEIRQAIADGDQVILLRNRRGYAPMLLCRACGEDFRCPDCGLPRTYHRRDRRLVCHYCGNMIPAPARCPVCSEEALEAIGAGTERVEEDFKELFPGVTVDVLDRDTARRPGGLAALLERFGRGEIQVLIGTQMVSKGHHFPNVALTAVLAADAYLGFPDFRAVERTYNLLTQVAGRAGRGERPGRVVIQTYHPGHYAIQAALRQDDEGFAREEMRFRRVFHYPPYTRMVQILVRDKSREKAQGIIAGLAADLAAHPLGRGVRLSGPAPAPLERLRGQWRFQLLARTANFRDLHRLLKEVLPKNPGYDLVVDVDPQQLL
ncbi:MAG TPA: primosomal protein N' [Thermoanaerobaculia bacterium]|jgi:primosomal protein N' (replication factor Y)|nr:primosomal protein N' [Thermoanaerobaculia bacterium]